MNNGNPSQPQPASPASAAGPPQPSELSHGLSLPHKIVVCQHIARLIRARLPIVGELSEQVAGKRGATAGAVRSVDDDLAAGISLQSALASDRSREARSLAACIEAGTQANRLDQALEAWSTMHLALDRARKSFASAMLYPILLIIIMLCSLSYMIWQSVPAYEATFRLLVPTMPVWLSVAIWVRQWIVPFMIVTFLLTLLPLLWWFRRRRQFDADGRSYSKTQRLYSESLATELAAFMLISECSLQRAIELSVQSTGAGEAVIDRAFSQVQAQQLVPVLGRETSLILSGLHAGIIDRDTAMEHLGEVRSHLQLHASLSAKRDANWLPMLVAILVGCVTLLIYVGLIYGPWILLLRRIVEPSDLTLP